MKTKYACHGLISLHVYFHGKMNIKFKYKNKQVGGGVGKTARDFVHSVRLLPKLVLMLHSIKV